MILAYLRGLLKPNYEFGTYSQLRELIVVQGIQREIQGETEQTRAVIESNLLSVFQARAPILETYKASVEHLMRGQELRLLHRPKVVIEKLGKSDRSVEDMAAALKVLKSTDLADRMARILAKV